MILPKSEKDSAIFAAKILKSGKIAILPTDTVYGFSGIAATFERNFHTEKTIAHIKGSNPKKPLIQLIAHPNDVYNYTDEILPCKIFEKWPGPVTIIVKNNARYEKLTHRKTTAFRCPADEWLCHVIELCAAPIYSTSANFSGAPIIEKVSELCAQFSSQVDLIVTSCDKFFSRPSKIFSVAGGIVEVIRD